MDLKVRRSLGRWLLLLVLGLFAWAWQLWWTKLVVRTAIPAVLEQPQKRPAPPILARPVPDLDLDEREYIVTPNGITERVRIGNEYFVLKDGQLVRQTPAWLPKL